MERSRVTLITLVCGLITIISGIVVEMTVKPGDNVTIYCDCTLERGFKIVWLKKPSHQHQPPEDVYDYGNRFALLSLLDTVVSCASLPRTTSTPPLSDCSVCWKLLVILCPMCVLISSLLSSLCVYCTNRNATEVDQRGNTKMRKHNEVEDDDVCYASLDIPKSGQKRLKKRTAESSDFCMYSEVKAEKMLAKP